MAKKHYNQTIIEPGKIDIPDPETIKPVEKAEEKKPQKTKYLRVMIRGSLTIWGMRYEGLQEWQESDRKLVASKGQYDIVGEVWK